MASFIPLLEDNRVIGLDGKPLASLPVNAWSGLPFEVHPHMRRAEVAHRINPHPLLLVHERSHGRGRIQSGRAVYEFSLAPGHVDVFSSGFHMDRGWWDCTPGEVLAVDIGPVHVKPYVHDDMPPIDPSTRLATRDAVLERLVGCVRSEVEGGCTSGRLFAESLSIALITRLQAAYGHAERFPQRARKLSAAQSRRTLEYIDANLAGDLSVASLAAELGISPCAFSRMFKAAFGTPPHACVLARRLLHAQTLLVGDRALSEVALASGFASQSHFTDAFRRRFGHTPAEARRRRR